MYITSTTAGIWWWWFDSFEICKQIVNLLTKPFSKIWYEKSTRIHTLKILKWISTNARRDLLCWTFFFNRKISKVKYINRHTTIEDYSLVLFHFIFRFSTLIIRFVCVFLLNWQYVDIRFCNDNNNFFNHNLVILEGKRRIKCCLCVAHFTSVRIKF